MLADTKVYEQMLGQPGSTPLDLYRDLIVRVEDEVYPERKLAQTILKVILWLAYIRDPLGIGIRVPRNDYVRGVPLRHQERRPQ